VSHPETGEAHPRKAVYLLPNLFTTAGMFSGFFAIIAATGGRFSAAAVAVVAAFVLDGIDGRIARLTHTQTEFGAQYDSLADLVSFGLAPALIIYNWSLASMVELGGQMGKLGWLAAFFYTAMAAMRLARFNVQLGSVDKRYFLGLASPSGAMLLASFVWTCEVLGVRGTDPGLWIPSLLLTIGAGALMISPIRYYSFKDLGQRERIPFFGVLVVVLLFVLVAVDPPKVLLAGFGIYSLSGPVSALWRRLRRRRSSS